MAIPLLGGQSFGQFDADSGEFLPDKARRIHELIQAFDDTLFLQMIPVRLRGPEDTKPYRIVQVHPEYEPYVIMNLSEDELDHRVLATLFDARDAVDNKDVARRMESMDAAREILMLKQRQDEREEMMDKAKFLIRTPKHTVEFEGKRLHL